MNITIDGVEYEETSEFHGELEGLYYKDQWYLPKKEEELCVPIGTKFIVNDVNSNNIYSIDEISDDSVKISWVHDGRQDYTEFSIKSVNKYFKDGIWIEYKPLFTTTDGVDIFKDDEFYYIGDAFNICKTNILWYGDVTTFRKMKTFSTYKAAQNYVENYKPILSFNDVWNMNHSKKNEEGYIIIAKKDLQNLVKNKLK
jgi:hypothetical protein